MQSSQSKESLVYHETHEHPDAAHDFPTISYGSTDEFGNPTMQEQGSSASFQSPKRQPFQDVGPNARRAGRREQKMERLTSVRSMRVSFKEETIQHKHKHRPFLQVLSEMIFGNPMNLLLIALPFAWASHHFEWSSTNVFIWNFIAMVPLAALLGNFTEEVAAHTNQTIGGLINASFGNAVEVVVSIQVRFFCFAITVRVHCSTCTCTCNTIHFLVTYFLSFWDSASFRLYSLERSESCKHR